MVFSCKLCCMRVACDKAQLSRGQNLSRQICNKIAIPPLCWSPRNACIYGHSSLNEPIRMRHFDKPETLIEKFLLRLPSVCSCRLG